MKIVSVDIIDVKNPLQSAVAKSPGCRPHQHR